MYREIVQSYTEFNPVKFLKDAKNWESRRKALEKDFEKISELPAQSGGERVQTSNLSDLTVQTAIKREEIIAKSNRLIKSIEMLDYGLKHLDESEREVITQYYFSGKAKDASRYQLGMKYAKSERSMYRWINDILDKFKEIIVEKYYS